jgi:hypothetical protein
MTHDVMRAQTQGNICHTTTILRVIYRRIKKDWQSQCQSFLILNFYLNKLTPSNQTVPLALA